MADRCDQYCRLRGPLVLGGAPYPQQQKKHTVDSAAGQLDAFRRRAAETCCDGELTQILRRSESIYHQAVDNYNRTFSRPWLYLPARLMGFRRIPQPANDHCQTTE